MGAHGGRLKATKEGRLMNNANLRWKPNPARIRVSTLIMGAAFLVGGCAVGSNPLSSGADNPAFSGQVAATASRQLVQYGFAVLDFRARRDEFSRVFVVGEAKNVGLADRGVEFQAALRDRTGRLLTVAHFDLASGRSIAPDQTWPFVYSFGKQPAAVSAELRIVRTFRTVDAFSLASASR
jgi:hypothetical protein